MGFFLGGGELQGVTGIQIQMQQSLKRTKQELAEREDMCDDLETDIKMMEQQLVQKGVCVYGGKLAGTDYPTQTLTYMHSGPGPLCFLLSFSDGTIEHLRHKVAGLMHQLHELQNSADDKLSAEEDRLKQQHSYRLV